MRRLLLGLVVVVGGAGQEPAAPRDRAQESTAYTEVLPGSDVAFEMVPIAGGSFLMGSVGSERGRRTDEGPQHEVELGAFWMGRHEVSWDEYRIFMAALDLRLPDELPPGVDAVARPTPPYVPMDFGMGVEGFPAIAMTQFAARQYTRWLSAMTGRFYRLPTEAEWEYACRAGVARPPKKRELGRRLAWFADTSDGSYRETGAAAANGWGLHDMLGNVAEWTLDGFGPYGDGAATRDPLVWPKEEWGRVVRGGSFRDEVEGVRCAARSSSRSAWKRRDPQFPKSIWYLTDAPFVGMRVVRPVTVPSPEEQERYWAADLDSVRRILEEQRSGAGR